MPAIPKSKGLAFRPEWRHVDFVLSIGDGKYTFRSLSLYDVWCLWPHITPVSQALEKGLPIQFAQHFLEALEHLCPGLTTTEDFEKKWTFVHFNALIEFYMKQDWARIVALRDSASGEPLATDKGEITSEGIFFTICMAAARMSNMSVVEFVEQRFEYCADAFVTLHAQVMEAKDKENEGKLNPGQLLAVAQGMFPTDDRREETEKPAWIQDIERMTAELDAKRGKRVQ
jgi:hypothetical protein